MMNFALKTRNFVSKTRNIVLKLMNFADFPGFKLAIEKAHAGGVMYLLRGNVTKSISLPLFLMF